MIKKEERRFLIKRRKFTLSVFYVLTYWRLTILVVINKIRHSTPPEHTAAKNSGTTQTTVTY
jgi:hypothetical protein